MTEPDSWIRISALLLVSLSAGVSVPGQENADGILLAPDRSLERRMTAAETHRYRVSVAEGTAANILVDQYGIDLVVTVLGTEGEKLREFDAPVGADGPESVFVPSAEGGMFRLEVRALDAAAPPGRYVIRLRGALSLAEYHSREVREDTEQWRDWYLNFQLSEDRIVSVGPSDEFGAAGRLMYVDTGTGRFGMLRPLADGTFYSAATLVDDFPVAVRLAFRRDADGRIASLDWREEDQPQRSAPRVFPAHVEEVAFANGDVKLRGLLVVPDGSGPCPAVVYVHGSGDATRHAGFFHSYFQRLGLAVLAFDKRGAGESTGDWRRSSLGDLADDVLAGVGFLASRPDIDPDHIGLFGISQAGWVASLAAARSPHVDFLVINCGSGVSVVENMVYERDGTLREAGAPVDQIPPLLEFYRRLLQAAADGRPWEEIEELRREGRSRPWAAQIPALEVGRDSVLWDWLRRNGNYDGSTILRQVHCPVLWFLADRDRNVPSQASRPRLEAALAAGGNEHGRVVMLSPATHVMFRSETGFFSEVMRSDQGFIPGYWGTLTQWLGERLTEVRR